jgi:hypothetical protein
VTDVQTVFVVFFNHILESSAITLRLSAKRFLQNLCQIINH